MHINIFLLFQMHIPNFVEIYGSQYIDIEVHTSYKFYTRKIYVRKTHLKALDQPSERCSSDTMTLNTSACIAKFIEKELGCTTQIHGSIMGQKMTCTNATQLLTWKQISRVLQEANANKIYKMTGCLAACERDEYKQIDGTLTKVFKKGNNDIKLDFRILSNSYQEMEQYFLYDTDSFIADVGGFMGLLLGFSALSLYNELVNILGRFKFGCRANLK